MNDFIFHNPAKVYFGKGQMDHLSEELLKFGKKVLLVYGGGSIKKNGLFEHACGGSTISGLKNLSAADAEKIYEMCL